VSIHGLDLNETDLRKGEGRGGGLTVRWRWTDRVMAVLSGHPAKFTVTSIDHTRPAPVIVNIDGPSKVRLHQRDTAETCEFTYIVVTEGQYAVSVLSADQLPIPGSPFRPTFTSESPHKSSFRLGW